MSRAVADYYPTPRWAVRRLLDRLRERHKLGPFFGPILEPCAGDGAIVRAASEWFAEFGFAPPAWHLIDIRPECEPQWEASLLSVHAAALSTRVADFLRLPLDECPRADSTLTNPPFSLAMECVTRARDVAEVVAMLLRIGFLSSEERAEYFADPLNRPDVYVLPQRPSYYIKEASDTRLPTDSYDYAWMIWGQRAPRAASTWDVLDLTPLEERKRDSAGILRRDPQLALDFAALEETAP